MVPFTLYFIRQTAAAFDSNIDYMITYYTQDIKLYNWRTSLLIKCRDEGLHQVISHFNGCRWCVHLERFAGGVNFAEHIYHILLRIIISDCIAINISLLISVLSTRQTTLWKHGA